MTSSPHRGLTLWGFAAFASLFAWERILAQIYGPFPELSARVLALFLFGVTLGGLAVLLWPLPKPSPLRLPALSFLTGLAYALPLVLVNRLPLLFLSASAVPYDSVSFALRIWGIGALVVMPAAIGLGAMLPTLMGDVGGSLEHERPREHRDWVASVLGGGLLSSAVVAFWALPMLGFQRCLLGLAALLLGFAALLFAKGSQGARLIRIAGILLCLAMTLTLGRFFPRGDPRLLTTGVYRYAPEILKGFRSADFYRSQRKKALLPYYREGGEATVAIENVPVDGDPVLAVTMDGTVSATSFYDLVPQILSAELPLVVHPGSTAVFLAGYGTGVPAGSMLLHPLRTLDIAEAEPAVVEASRSFEPMNRTPRSDPRVRIATQDPGQLLHSKGRGSYDVILLRPTAPEAASSRFLLTRGFFRLAASRLKPDGLLAQVVPLQGMSLHDVASVVKTLQASFRDVVVFQTYYQELLVLASDQPIRFDLPAMRQAVANERIRTDLSRIGVLDPESLVVRYRVSGKGAEAFAGSGRILEDGSAPLAWSPYRIGGEPEAAPVVEALNRTSTGLGKRIAPLPEGKEGNDLLLGLARSALAARDPIRAADLAESLLARKDISNGHQVLGDAWYIQGEQLKAVEEWHAALDADPRNANALMSLADFNSDRNNHAEAVQYLGQLLAIHPDDAAALFARGRAFYELKRTKESEADLARALALKGESGAPLSLYYLGLIQKNKGNLQGAAEFLRRYLQWGYRQGRLTPVEADVHFALADVYRGLQLPDLAQQQRTAGEALKQRLQQSAQNTREAVFEYLHKR